MHERYFRFDFHTISMIGWTAGLLLSSYFSVHEWVYWELFIGSKKALIIDIVVTILMIVLICIGLIPTTTAWYLSDHCVMSSYQYTISGAVMGILAAYLFTKSPLASYLGLKEHSDSSATVQQSPQPENDTPKRVTVGKHLMNFEDLRSTTVSYVCHKQR